MSDFDQGLYNAARDQNNDSGRSSNRRPGRGSETGTSQPIDDTPTFSSGGGSSSSSSSGGVFDPGLESAAGNDPFTDRSDSGGSSGGGSSDRRPGRGSETGTSQPIDDTPTFPSGDSGGSNGRGTSLGGESSNLRPGRGTETGTSQPIDNTPTFPSGDGGGSTSGGGVFDPGLESAAGNDPFSDRTTTTDGVGGNGGGLFSNVNVPTGVFDDLRQTVSDTRSNLFQTEVFRNDMQGEAATDLRPPEVPNPDDLYNQSVGVEGNILRDFGMSPPQTVQPGQIQQPTQQTPSDVLNEIAGGTNQQPSPQPPGDVLNQIAGGQRQSGDARAPVRSEQERLQVDAAAALRNQVEQEYGAEVDIGFNDVVFDNGTYRLNQRGQDKVANQVPEFRQAASEDVESGIQESGFNVNLTEDDVVIVDGQVVLTDSGREKYEGAQAEEIEEQLEQQVGRRRADRLGITSADLRREVIGQTDLTPGEEFEIYRQQVDEQTANLFTEFSTGFLEQEAIADFETGLSGQGLDVELDSDDIREVTEIDPDTGEEITTYELTEEGLDKVQSTRPRERVAFGTDENTFVGRSTVDEQQAAFEASQLVDESIAQMFRFGDPVSGAVAAGSEAGLLEGDTAENIQTAQTLVNPTAALFGLSGTPQDIQQELETELTDAQQIGAGTFQTFNPARLFGGAIELAEFGEAATRQTIQGGIDAKPRQSIIQGTPEADRPPLPEGRVPATGADREAGAVERSILGAADEAAQISRLAGGQVVDNFQAIEQQFRADPIVTGGILAGSLIASAGIMGGAAAIGPRVGQASRLAIQPGEEIAGIGGFRATRRLAGEQRAQQLFPNQEPLIFSEEFALRQAQRATDAVRRRTNQASQNLALRLDEINAPPTPVLAARRDVVEAELTERDIQRQTGERPGGAEPFIDLERDIINRAGIDTRFGGRGPGGDVPTQLAVRPELETDTGPSVSGGTTSSFGEGGLGGASVRSTPPELGRFDRRISTEAQEPLRFGDTRLQPGIGRLAQTQAVSPFFAEGAYTGSEFEIEGEQEIVGRLGLEFRQETRARAETRSRQEVRIRQEAETETESEQETEQEVEVQLPGDTFFDDARKREEDVLAGVQAVDARLAATDIAFE